ncbi:hypothetical protein ACQPYA_23055 [Micromonospora sp. CA-263727]|uniref:hypothetical protein n=1 Tax=Micromonospora sp. CA-263727 TaxID=3239967 RepID=UPI003D903678
MNVNKRRDVAGVGQRAPRSGGRIAAERARETEDGTGRSDRVSRLAETRARGAREFPTQGSAALRPVERTDAGTAERAESPRLRVAPPPPVRVPRAPFAALVVLLVVGGVLGILAVNTKVNENSFRLNELQKQQAELDLKQQQLRKQIDDAEAPGNLAANARKLGLVESGELGLIRLPDGKLIGVPQPAVGQPSIASQGAEG